MLANPDIHVVDISSYPSQHRNQAVAAANAKKHIILEKPMANSLQEVREIAAAAKANGVKGCVCFECRWSNQFQVTKALIDEGLLGSLHYGEVDYYHGIGPWYGQFRWNTGKKDGGSALLTAGCHALDALLMIMGTKSRASPASPPNPRATSSSPTSTTPPASPSSTSRTAASASRRRRGLPPALLLPHPPLRQPGQPAGRQVSLHEAAHRQARVEQALHEDARFRRRERSSLSKSQFQAFFDALDEGKDMPLTSFTESLKSFEVIFASDKSAELGGKPVKISDLG
jgi:UDP-N-acetyl-2-amino-2-deoxyglucuronate dehydrogenase